MGGPGFVGGVPGPFVGPGIPNQPLPAAAPTPLAAGAMVPPEFTDTNAYNPFADETHSYLHQVTKHVDDSGNVIREIKEHTDQNGSFQTVNHKLVNGIEVQTTFEKNINPKENSDEPEASTYAFDSGSFVQVSVGNVNSSSTTGQNSEGVTAPPATTPPATQAGSGGNTSNPPQSQFV